MQTVFSSSPIVILVNMSASAIGLSGRASAGFWSSTVGKKAVMAVTGVVLFGYVIGHLVGNLQIFLPNGRESINHYAVLLHTYPAALWAVRIFLLAMIGLHIAAYMQLGTRKLQARPIGYVKKKSVGSSLAARTMYWSGPFIAAYVIYHILHLTTGTLHPGFREGDVYDNVVTGFQSYPVAIVYIVAILLLCMHLYHGLWSWIQSLGLHHPRYSPLLKRVAAVVAILIAAGYISIPVAVMTGLVH
jgi:succinate dehydrogenase / fumarate reductase cytochrome b subunit